MADWNCSAWRRKGIVTVSPFRSEFAISTLHNHLAGLIVQRELPGSLYSLLLSRKYARGSVRPFTLDRPAVTVIHNIVRSSSHVPFSRIL